MRILADENLPRALVEVLRGRGHDVVWVRIARPGASDQSLLRRASKQKRIIVTFDKDFGALTFAADSPRVGVVLIRHSAMEMILMPVLVARALESRDDWGEHFSVIDERRLRMRSLPVKDAKRPRRPSALSPK